MTICLVTTQLQWCRTNGTYDHFLRVPAITAPCSHIIIIQIMHSSWLGFACWLPTHKVNGEACRKSEVMITWDPHLNDPWSPPVTTAMRTAGIAVAKWCCHVMVHFRTTSFGNRNSGPNCHHNPKTTWINLAELRQKDPNYFYMCLFSMHSEIVWGKDFFFKGVSFQKWHFYGVQIMLCCYHKHQNELWIP